MNPQLDFIKTHSPELYAAIIEKKLWCVRSLQLNHPELETHLKAEGMERYFNKENVLNEKKIFDIPYRLGFNHALNKLVTPFTGLNNWECKPYIFLEPLLHYVGELYGGNQQDLITIGYGHTFSEDSILLVPENEVEKWTKEFKVEGQLKSKITGYKYPEQLRELVGTTCLNEIKRNIKSVEGVIEMPRFAVNKTLKKLGAWVVEDEYQYSDMDADKQRITNHPKYIPSSINIDKYSFRVNVENKKHNVDELLSQVFKLEKADDTHLEKVTTSKNKDQTTILNYFNLPKSDNGLKELLTNTTLLSEIKLDDNKWYNLRDSAFLVDFYTDFYNTNALAESLLQGEDEPLTMHNIYDEQIQTFLTVSNYKIARLYLYIELIYNTLKYLDMSIDSANTNTNAKLKSEMMQAKQAFIELIKSKSERAEHFLFDAIKSDEHFELNAYNLLFDYGQKSVAKESVDEDTIYYFNTYLSSLQSVISYVIQRISAHKVGGRRTIKRNKYMKRKLVKRSKKQRR